MISQTDTNVSKPILNEHHNEIDLSEIFRVLWVGKIQIISITAMFAIGSVIYALSIPNQYKASVLLAPAQSDGGGLSSALGQLGGLVSLAGVEIVEGEATESQIAQEIMSSWHFVETFILENNLGVEVFAAENWKKGSNQLIINEDLFNTEVGEWLVEDESGKLGPPSSWKLFEKFSEMLSIEEDKQSGLVRVSIEYFSPTHAHNWLEKYILAINKHMQERKVERVSNNIQYLKTQIERTSISEMKEVFYTIIEEQMKNKMVAEASPEYVFLTVSPSMVPELKSQPKRALICILLTLLGGMLSILLVLFKHYLNKAKVN